MTDQAQQSGIEEVGQLYRAISLGGVSLAIVGALVEVYLLGEVRRGLVPLEELPGQVWSGNPSAWTTMGIWVLIMGPILALISLLVSGVRRRDWPMVGLSVAVLLVIIMSVPIKTWLQGGL